MFDFLFFRYVKIFLVTDLAIEEEYPYKSLLSDIETIKDSTEENDEDSNSNSASPCLDYHSISKKQSKHIKRIDCEYKKILRAIIKLFKNRYEVLIKKSKDKSIPKSKSERIFNLLLQDLERYES